MNCVFEYKTELAINPLTLADRKVEFRLYEKGFFSNSEVGIASVALNHLKNSHTYENIVVFSGKKAGAKLEFGFYIREPLDKFTWY